MGKGGDKPVIGLTGGVGAGKTTVAEQFESLGCAVISADKLSHMMLERREVIDELVRWARESGFAPAEAV